MKNCITTENLSQILEGLNKSVNIVKTTMGARGKVVAIKDDNQKLRFTKDGVTVAKMVDFEDKFAAMGAEIVRLTASKTVEEVGDGTTCTSVMLQAFMEILAKVDVLKLNEVLTDIEEDIQRVSDYLRTHAISVDNSKDIEQVATIAANSEKLGKLFAEVYSKVSFDSLVSLEMGESEQTSFEVKQGMEFAKGYEHVAFANQTNQHCILDNPIVYATAQPILATTEIDQFLQYCLDNQVPALIIAQRFSTEVLRLCVQNIKTGLSICLVKLPGYGRYAVENVKDIKSYLNNDKRIEKAVIGPNFMRLFNSDKPNMEARLEELENLIPASIDAIEEADYIKRVHRLKGTTAVIYAGGITEEATEEEFDRLEDALGSVKAAIKEGFIAGGGLALLSAAKVAQTDTLKYVLNKPILQILKNANEDHSEIISKVNMQEDKEIYTIGYDVRNREYVNFVQKGIVDPVKVLTQSLSNSFSAAKLLVNTSHAINISYDKNKLF